jgi:hypothetical protein
MIEESLLKSNFIGKDGFIWWIGQIAPPSVWRDERSEIDSEGWAYRCKVRIIGYHTFDGDILPDQDLPWAHVMVDPVDGTSQGGLGKSHNLVGGETAFGFFLDGDDAQQPVVVGLIFRNKSTQSLITPELINQEKSSQFRPFTGHQGNMAIKETQRRGTNKGTQGEASRPSSPPAIVGVQPSDDGPSPISQDLPPSDPSADQIFDEDSALNAALKESLSITIQRENGCSNNSIGKITQVLQDFVAFVNGLQKFRNTYIDPVLNTVVDIGNQIKSAASKIAGLLKGMLNIMRSTIMGLVSKLFREFIALILPEPQVPTVGEATKNILNLIFCLFEKLLDELSDFIEDMLLGLIGRAVSVPLCAAEEWIGALLNKVTELLDDLLAPIFSGIEWLTGGLDKISDVLSKASSIANKIISFIGCDALKCETPSEWSMNFGPSESNGESWSRVLDNMNVLKTFNGGVDEAVSYLSVYGFGDGYFPSCSQEVVNGDPPLGVRARTCRPPTLSVIGGGGMGVSAIPIVSSGGEIIAVSVLDGGYGFKSTPSVRIKDKSNCGKGARLQAVVVEESVQAILVIAPGSGYAQDDYSSIALVPFYVVYADRYSIREGEIVTFTVQGYNLQDQNSYKVRYEILGLEESERDGVDLSGQITLNSEGRFNLQLRPFNDDSPEGIDIVEFNLYDSNSNYVARTIVMVNDTSLPTTIIPTTLPESPPGTPVPAIIPTQGIQGLQETIGDSIRLQGIQGIAGDMGIQGIQGIGNIVGSQGITGIGATSIGIQGINVGLDTNIPSIQGIIYDVIPPGIGTDINIGVGSTIINIGDPGLISDEIEVIVTDIIVSSPGIGYTSGDRIVVGGISTFIPIITDRGSIIGAEPDPRYPFTVNNSFSRNPILSINTLTGEGAAVFPLTELKRKYKTSPRIINRSGNLSVIDCI